MAIDQSQSRPLSQEEKDRAIEMGFDPGAVDSSARDIRQNIRSAIGGAAAAARGQATPNMGGQVEKIIKAANETAPAAPAPAAPAPAAPAPAAPAPAAPAPAAPAPAAPTQSFQPPTAPGAGWAAMAGGQDRGQTIGQGAGAARQSRLSQMKQVY